jgi:hypothetical protein
MHNFLQVVKARFSRRALRFDAVALNATVDFRFWVGVDSAIALC